jgi:hypothetical protein
MTYDVRHRALVANGVHPQCYPLYFWYENKLTTLFMVFSVTYNICKGPKLDA